ncbi:hypothetical protein N7499_002958 [Penicillium canescens]|uniref:Uncharacterized protein n=1 Tax=Penicillium canescens TaxID=5083 RepID=A0AAD6N7V9_PENCN|nr:uncharacterized protein N7446_011830 [Penicillium canescens]XP_058369557.1 uncharacterized protein N7446_010024 [Penicillium canescens]KAJ5475755.1 hypothetical protein N7475_001484 [Penicillium sp. IBT 31633x]KAJ6019906.1 hypothetical protein N7522_000614 [Penicillium canescens]KAJ6035268.1 hypothetical protein N7460_009443 [Penicillium canescens]KAJ6039235.1 hypothetical protein N7460_007267 [Penicillium canescens]KAJ6046922.1 hypothetical protein N7444_008176 [Penicillium canescens]
MVRTIHLAIFSNGARPAHYAVFVPSGDAGKVGKLIHVTGTTATGFFREFKRNYDFNATQRKHHIIPLAQVDGRFITDTVGNGQPGVDTTARDRLESAATVVLPPGRSPNPFDPSAPNCQDWLQSYVQKLVEEGLIAGSAISVVQNAPKLL